MIAARPSADTTKIVTRRVAGACGWPGSRLGSQDRLQGGPGRRAARDADAFDDGCVGPWPPPADMEGVDL